MPDCYNGVLVETQDEWAGRDRMPLQDQELRSCKITKAKNKKELRSRRNKIRPGLKTFIVHQPFEGCVSYEIKADSEAEAKSLAAEMLDDITDAQILDSVLFSTASVHQKR